MQPQNTNTVPGAYDFLNQPPSQPGRKLPLPQLPRTAWVILIGSILVLGLLVLASLLFGGRSGSSSPYIESMSLAQEIARVSDNVEQISNDPRTQGLAATTSSVMLSSNTQLGAYLKDSGVKVDPKALGTKMDSDIDTQLQEASQSNRLTEAYSRYLKIYLADYRGLLQTASGKSGPDVKAIIQDAIDSVDIILSSQLVNSIN